MHNRLFAGLAVAASAPAAPAAAGSRDWAKASHIGRDALVVAALGIPAVKGDWHGDVQAGWSMLATEGVTFALKELIHERRPDGSDNKSFPSRHSSISFAAAATLEKRYGWKFGLPALGAATFVGASRVAADKHYAHDVVVGAAIGGAAGRLLTSRHDDRLTLLPWAAHRGGGVTVATRW